MDRSLFKDKVRLGWLLFKPLFWWTDTRVSLENLKEQLSAMSGASILYVIPSQSYVDRLILYEICHKHGLPLPSGDLKDLQVAGNASYLSLRKPQLSRDGRLSYEEPALQNTLSWLRENPASNVALVPVSFYWGKDPGKEEQTIFKLLFSDDENARGLQRLFIVLAHGRNNIVKFTGPLVLRRLVDEDVSSPAGRLSTKLQRVMNLYFRRERAMVLGAKLYDRDRIISQIVNAPAVRNIVDAHPEDIEQTYKLRLKARAYAREIAADMSYSVILAFTIILRWLWNKLYKGIDVSNLEPVKELANKKYEIVYFSNHRSHLDYLLVNYSLYANDLPTPHTAAGKNLDFFPIGPIFRRGGAFFIRRSFRGNRLYTAVFNEYLHYLLSNGHPVQFFPEGGRSRTGRLRQPKSGFLSMIVHSYLRDPHREIAFVPVHINYDRVVEVGSYLKELSGGAKRKESVIQLFKSLGVLKKNWGKAYINFGRPMLLSEILRQKFPEPGGLMVGPDEKPLWFSDFVDRLARDLMIRVNSAASVTPISLISFALLATIHKAMPEEELLLNCEALLKLLEKFGYSEQITLPEGSFADHQCMAEALGSFKRFKHDGGDILHLDEIDAILVGYYRNNIIHLFALPSLIARLFSQNERFFHNELRDILIDVYPFFQRGYFLPWLESEIPALTDELLGAMVEAGFLTKGGEGGQIVYQRPPIEEAGYDFLVQLGNALGNVIESFAITALLLTQIKEGGALNLELFTQQAQKMAQRLTILNGVSMPTSSKGSVFQAYLQLLEQMGYVTIAEEGIIPREGLQRLIQRSRLVLSSDMRNCLGKVTGVKI